MIPSVIGAAILITAVTLQLMAAQEKITLVMEATTF